MKELSEAAKLSEHIRKTNPATARSLSKRSLVCGVGLNNADYVAHYEGGMCPAYRLWYGVIERCYSDKRLKKWPTYSDCTVAEEWHNFMCFRAWWAAHHVDGFDLDKDLLIPGNRIYDPDACCFVPHSINSFLSDSGAIRGELPIGVYFDKRRGRFGAGGRYGSGKKVRIGSFDCPNLAHLAWQKFKLARLESLRSEMDAIDPRIYVNAKSKILSYAADMRAVA